ncbi:MAG: DUF58 domain-containing protein [Actinomycetota bacterium]|nr:DUF58 domain-containing protein [Actinomycetota bacterium]
MSPTPRAALLLAAISLSALALPLTLVAALAVAALSAAVVDASYARRRPEVSREVPFSLARGHPARLRVTSTPPAGSAVDVRQAAPPDVEISPSEARGDLDATLVARRRGSHDLPGVAIRSTGPLGLGAWYHPAGETTSVRVLPDMPAAHRMVEAIRRSRFGDAGRRMRGPLGLGTDFEAIREYLPDDDIRQVNWRATARLGRPMSNQYRVEQDRDVICVVDSGRLMAAPFGDRTRLDATIDAVAAIASVADELDDRCGVIAFDSKILRRVAPGRRKARDVIEAIYDLEPSPTDSDYELAFRAVGGGKRSLVIVLTDLVEETAARPLLDAVPVLTRRHEVIVAGAEDVDLRKVLAQEPADPLDVYRSSAALEVLEARSRVSARLRASGAYVLEAPPEGLGAACVRAYLRAKVRARL